MQIIDMQQQYLDPHHNMITIALGQFEDDMPIVDSQYTVLMSYSDPFMVIDSLRAQPNLLALNAACNRADDVLCAFRFLDEHNLLQSNETWPETSARLARMYHPYIFNRQSPQK